MKIERAIEILDPEHREQYESIKVVEEACRMGMEALKKQIPRKPIIHKVDVEKIKIGNANWGKGTTVYKCPCCDGFISRLYDFCHKCGQALDWGDVT